MADLLRSIGTAEAPGPGAPGRDLRPDLPAPAALASILGHLLETVRVNVPGTLARHDEESQLLRWRADGRWDRLLQALG